MIGGSRKWSSGELRQVLRDQAGLDLVALRAVGAGESRRAFWVTDRAGTVSVLKILPDAPPEAVGHLRALEAVLARLRDRGYPAPRGVLEKVVATARQRLAAGMAPVPVTLRDGTAAGLRPVYPGDQQELMRGELFSAQTRYRRFLGGEQVTPALARYLTEVDYVDHFAWVALGSADVWAGGATYVRSASDRALADISFLITDEFQGRGLGTLLMGAVAIVARRNGISRFSADVLAENAPMRAILDRAGIEWETVEAGVMHGCVVIPDPGEFGIMPGTAAALAAVVEEMKLRRG